MPGPLPSTLAIPEGSSGQGSCQLLGHMEWGDKTSGAVWRRGYPKTKGHNMHAPDGKTTV